MIRFATQFLLHDFEESLIDYDDYGTQGNEIHIVNTGVCRQTLSFCLQTEMTR